MLLLPLLLASIESAEDMAFFMSNIVADSANLEDDGSARAIAERIKKKHACFEALSKSYSQLCVNLDVEKRINLSVETLVCELRRDGRYEFLPPLAERYEDRDYKKFVQELPTDTFSTIFTNIFISIDTICFHATNEAQSTANIRTVDRIWKASSIATEYLIQSKEQLQNITREVRDKLEGVHEAINNTEKKIARFQEKIGTIIDQFKQLEGKATYYKNSVSNMKFYLIGVAVGFFMNLVVPNVFIPTIAVTALYLLFEVNVGGIAVGSPVFKWSYAVIVLLVNSYGVYVAVKPLQGKVAQKSGQLRIPLQFSQSISHYQ